MCDHSVQSNSLDNALREVCLEHTQSGERHETSVLSLDMEKRIIAYLKNILKAMNVIKHLPPKDAATATEPPTVPAAVAAAANPLTPITGMRVPSVGARAPSPAAIAGAANPVEYPKWNIRFNH